MIWRPIKFAFVGVANSLVDLAVFAALVSSDLTGAILANVISYSSGIICSYFLNLSWTFSDRRSLGHDRFFHFLAVSFAAMVINTCALAVAKLFCSLFLAKLLATLVSCGCGYIFTSRFVFRSTNKSIAGEVTLQKQAGLRTPCNRRKIAVVLLSPAGAFLFLIGDLDRFPLVLWDESRLAVNALEMSLQGFSFVTTYEFKPDLWNTKPSLQIWLISIAFLLFDSPEFALRIPSALAALATIAIVSIFVARFSRSLFIGILAGVLLISSKNYYGNHVARTGDYDSLLTLFTTCYTLLIFQFIHRLNARPYRLVMIGACVACAVFTKGIAGLIPGVGIPAYLALMGRSKRLLTEPKVLLVAGTTIILVVGYYLLREHLTPGFLRAVLHNELGRYTTNLDPLVASNTSPFVYLKNIILGLGFSLGPAAIVVLSVGFYSARSKMRIAIFYFLFVSVSFLVAISLGSTRYYWYDAPIYPLLSIACALSIHSTMVLIRERQPFRMSSKPFLAVVAIGMVLLCVKAIRHRYIYLLQTQDAYEGQYGPLFKKLPDDGAHSIVVVDAGRGDGAGEDPTGHYNPILRFYMLLNESRRHASIAIRYRSPFIVSSDDPNTSLVSCNPHSDLMQSGDLIASPVEGCIVAKPIGGLR
jgi:putative flippase GtrA